MAKARNLCVSSFCFLPRLMTVLLQEMTLVMASLFSGVGFPRVTQLLLDASAWIERIPGFDAPGNYSALEFAVAKGIKPAVAQLIAAKALVNTGQSALSHAPSPLAMAANVGDPEIVKMLLAANAEAQNSPVRLVSQGICV